MIVFNVLKLHSFLFGNPAQDHHLPGQQDSGPQATFPYNHHHQRDEEAFSTAKDSFHQINLKNSTRNFHLEDNDLKNSTRILNKKPSRIILHLQPRQQPIHYPPSVKSNLASASPILTSMLSEPTTKQKQAFTGEY